MNNKIEFLKTGGGMKKLKLESDGSETSSTSSSDRSSGSGSDLELMPEFFEKVDKIQKDLDLVEEEVGEIKRICEESLNSTNSTQSEELSQQVKASLSRVSKVNGKIKVNIENLEKENKEKMKEKAGIAETRIRQNQTQALKTKFVNLLSQLNSVQENNKEKLRDKVSRQCKIVNPEITEEQIESVLEGGGQKSTQIFSGRQLQDAQDLVGQINAKHAEILNLEKSINELHQMFVDMALLVHVQGEMIDKIETNVVESKDYIQEGVVQVKQAIRYQKKSRKKMCFLMCIFGTVGVVVVLYFLLK
ncbi:syntaxin-1a [Anaeramoeba flamelloides]|uniref:Syntaxin-1a n=1 Tax=Anaeramoeba flamelloides TaxID=1746091 RepID=A0AAV7Z4P1_9EUKA|nr:syntaxin-1a [Anaeramoeba flamelloides]KAJ6244745.1 syntaxin-1a [Anaeramoeba flamelloides]